MKRGREQQLSDVQPQQQQQWPIVLFKMITVHGIHSQYFYHLPTLFNWYAVSRYHRHLLELTTPDQLLYVLTQKKERLRHQGSGKLHIEWRQQFTQLENAINIQAFFACLTTPAKLSHSMSTFTEPRDTHLLFRANDALEALLGAPDLTSDYVVFLLTQCRTLIATRYGWELTLQNVAPVRVGRDAVDFPWGSCAGMVLSITLRDTGLSPWNAQSKLWPCKNRPDVRPDTQEATCCAPTLTPDCLQALSEYAMECGRYVDTPSYFSWFATCHRLRGWFLARQDRQFDLLRAKHAHFSRYRGSLRVEAHRQLALLTNGMRIESLMKFLVTRLADAFSELEKMAKPFFVNPAFIGQALCSLSELTTVAYQAVAATNMASAYPLWLLAQCRARIANRYGWRLVLTIGDATLPFPWATRPNHNDIAVVVCDGAYRPGT